jgi:HlyD family secretion protein
MECEVLVDETDIRNLRLGQRAEVRVDALEGLTIQGEVTEIGSSAIPRGGTATNQATTGSSNTGNQAKDFRVAITLEKPPSTLRPGLNATADITTARKDAVLAAPIQAVVVRELNGEGKVVDPDAVLASETDTDSQTVLDVRKAKREEREGVFVVKDKKATFRAVKTGILGETEVEILEGLSPGEEIVTGSYKTLRTLKDAARIKPEETKKEKSWL